MCHGKIIKIINRPKISAHGKIYHGSPKTSGKNDSGVSRAPFRKTKSVSKSLFKKYVGMQ